MRRNRAPNAASLVLLALLAACTSPDPKYYMLQAVPPAAPPLPPGPPRVIELRRPGLAGYLDRADIVIQGGYRLSLAANEHWAEPFGDMIGRVLAEDLAARLPGRTLYTEAGAISTDPQARVELDVLRFDPNADGTVTLLAQVMTESGHGHTPGAARTLHLTARPADRSIPALAATMSTLLGELADQIARLLG